MCIRDSTHTHTHTLERARTFAQTHVAKVSTNETKCKLYKIKVRQLHCENARYDTEKV